MLEQNNVVQCGPITTCLVRAIFRINHLCDFWKFWNCPGITRAISEYSKMCSGNLSQIALANMLLLAYNYWSFSDNPLVTEPYKNSSYWTIIREKIKYYFKYQGYLKPNDDIRKIKDRFQISVLILSEFKRMNNLYPPEITKKLINLLNMRSWIRARLLGYWITVSLLG